MSWPRHNPYEIGHPVSADGSFVNRERELDWLRQAAANPEQRHVVVVGPRRIGKTSLILNAQAAVRKRGGRTGIANLFWCQTRQDVAQELANAVVRGPLGWLRGQAVNPPSRPGLTYSR